MEKLERSEALLTLGKRLVGALSSDEDLISDWMAHLIAERMQTVAAATSGEERQAAQEVCAREIARLWQHRYIAPVGVNPLADIVPLARTIESLQPGEHRFRYSADVLSRAVQEDGHVQSAWLSFARQADSAARDVIRFALNQAAAEITGNEDFTRALNEAIDAQLDVSLEVRLIELVGMHASEQDAAKEHDDEVRREATRLEAFAQTVLAVAADLRRSCTTVEEPPPAPISLGDEQSPSS